MPALVVAEKPSVARDIARVLGANGRGEGHLHGGNWLVTWAVGHLVALPQPHQVNPEWKQWRREHLPMLPQAWPLQVLEQTGAQFAVLKKLLASADVTEVVCATDAGREGELIFRLIYEAARCRKPFRRLWISSLTTEAIRDGFNRLQPGTSKDSLAAAARARAQADWLVGMNLSRAYTLQKGETFTVGRVQTPTLAMLVEREQAILAFVPEHYQHVVARFEAPGGVYQGTWFAPEPVQQDLASRKRLPPDGELARTIVDRVARVGTGAVQSVKQETRSMPPPLLYDLTELQRHANRLYGFSAKKTLDVAQRLYESHKLISYPRTDSRHLTPDVGATLVEVTAALGTQYGALMAPDTASRLLGKRFVDAGKVSDHHAVIPTKVNAQSLTLSADEAKVYDLIARRLLSAWHKDHVWAVTHVMTVVDSPGAQDRFHSQGTAVVETGWKVLDVKKEGSRQKTPRDKKDGDEDDDDEQQQLPPALEHRPTVKTLDVQALAKQTRPPKRYTEATLLSAMEGAGKLLDDKELSRAMKDRGLGTPATRAAILENLVKREYVTRQGKLLVPTDLGLRLVAAVHEDVRSPAMTGEWEAQLHQVERGALQANEFMGRVEEYVKQVVGRVGEQPAAPRMYDGPGAAAASAPVVLATRTAERTQDVGGLLTRVFGHRSFRPHQETVCRAAANGHNVLLVMPTGAGKSLCYQLPGLARGGTTLVISPLIALMEDQVMRLQQLGLAAERIHSGRDRAASRAVCQAYLDGQLDFLFIAPERLAIRGFPEMLARRKLALIAVDEAHCISQWGHDFRPDYRMLQQRLPLLMPAPVMALTATATPRVQDDIVDQLGLGHVDRFIHGFRRTNLGMEVVEVPKPQRLEVTARILSDAERRPAIVYAPSRAGAEETAAALSASFPCAAYHAGLTARQRETVQTAFLEGKLEAVVATIAFGMGVDKADIRTVVHLALPASLEGYYQEIGRAGRDGAPARAVLLHSYVDRRMHEFFRKQAYPDILVLEGLHKRVPKAGITRETLKGKARLPEDEFDVALEKLWIHGGVVVDGSDGVTPGAVDWRPGYTAQMDHRLAQEEAMARFTQGHGCRMVHLVRHFGDKADTGEPCGQCDVCNPQACVVQAFRDANGSEQNVMLRVLQFLNARGSASAGVIFREASGLSDRDVFEAVLSALARAGMVRVQEASFEKEGRSIAFQKVALGPAARGASEDSVAGVQVPTHLEGLSQPTRRKGGRAGKLARGGSRRGATKAAPADETLVKKLKAWRTSEARRRGVPAFRIMADKVLQQIASDKPRNAQALEQVSGVGPVFLKTYGAKVLGLLGPETAPRARQ